MKLYQQLESTFKMRINANSEIIPYIKKLSEIGKFDEPKKIAAIAILLDRLGKLEDQIEAEKSLEDLVSSTTVDDLYKDTSPEDAPSFIQELIVSQENVAAEQQLPATPDQPTVTITSDPGTITVNPPPPSIPDDPQTLPVTENTPDQAQPVDTSPTVTTFTPENITDTPPADPTV